MENTLKYSKAVQAAGDQIKPQCVDTMEIEVGFNPTEGILSDFVDAEFTAIEYYVSKHGGVLPTDFTKEAFQKYCNTCIVSRVLWVNGETKDLVFRPEERIMVPSLLDNVMKNIGVVYDTVQGYVLKPVICDDVEIETLSHDEMQRMSFFLMSLKEYIGALGFIKDKSGSWEFMTMQYVEGTILNTTDKAHPAFSILASVVAPRWLEAAVAAPRVRYGDVTFFRGLLWQLTSI